jgi:hypothetical protein
MNAHAHPSKISVQRAISQPRRHTIDSGWSDRMATDRSHFEFREWRQQDRMKIAQQQTPPAPAAR